MKNLDNSMWREGGGCIDTHATCSNKQVIVKNCLFISKQSQGLYLFIIGWVNLMKLQWRESLQAFTR